MYTPFAQRSLEEKKQVIKVYKDMANQTMTLFLGMIFLSLTIFLLGSLVLFPAGNRFLEGNAKNYVILFFSLLPVFALWVYIYKKWRCPVCTARFTRRTVLSGKCKHCKTDFTKGPY